MQYRGHPRVGESIDEGLLGAAGMGGHHLVSEEWFCEEAVKNAELAIFRVSPLPREVEANFANVFSTRQRADELSLFDRSGCVDAKRVETESATDSAILPESRL